MVNVSAIPGTYFNLILGTGSQEIGDAIKASVKARGTTGQNFGSAVYQGAKTGIKKSYNTQITNGGYFKNLWKSAKAIPDGWKAGTGFFSKLGGAFKGVGKTMPALFAISTILFEAPNVIKAIKEKGIVQGLKETGKTAVRLTTGAIGGALGSLIPIPVVGSMIGWTLGDMVGRLIVGKSYSEKVAENENQEDTNKDTDTFTPQDIPQPIAGTSADPAKIIDNAPIPSLPPIEATEFGPYKKFANVFYNYPEAYMDMGARMPGQSGMTGMMPGLGIGFGFPMVGLGIPNNQNPNLLAPTGQGNLLAAKSPSNLLGATGQGNLLTPTGNQNLYNKQTPKQEGSKLDITSK